MYVKEINTPFGLLNPHISQLNFFLPVRSLRHHPTLSRVRIVHFKMSHQLVEVGGAY